MQMKFIVETQEEFDVWYAKQSSDDIKQLVDTYTSDLIDLYDASRYDYMIQRP